jgi:hypothetical protein
MDPWIGMNQSHRPLLKLIRSVWDLNIPWI